MDLSALSTDLIATPPQMADSPAPAPVGEEAIAFHALLSAVKQGFAQLIPAEDTAASGKDLPVMRQAKADEDAGEDAPLETGTGDDTYGDADGDAAIWLPPSAAMVEAMPPKSTMVAVPSPVDPDAPKADETADPDQPVAVARETGRARRHDVETYRAATATATTPAIANDETETPETVTPAPTPAAPSGRTRLSEQAPPAATTRPDRLVTDIAEETAETTAEAVESAAPAARTAPARAALHTRLERAEPAVEQAVLPTPAKPPVDAPIEPRRQTPAHPAAPTPATAEPADTPAIVPPSAGRTIPSAIPVMADADAPATTMPTPRANAAVENAAATAPASTRTAPAPEALPASGPMRDAAPIPSAPLAAPSAPGPAIGASPTPAPAAPVPLPPASEAPQPVQALAGLVGAGSATTAPSPRTRMPATQDAAAPATEDAPAHSTTTPPAFDLRRGHDATPAVIAPPTRAEAVVTPPAPVDTAPPPPVAAVSVAAPVVQAATTPVQAVAQAMPPLDTTRADWIASLVDRIDEARGADGVRATSMKLRPEALGLLEVRIRIEGEQTHVSFRTENPAAHALITDAAQRLGDMVEARGLKLGQTQVDLSSGNPGGQRRDGPAPEERQRPNLHNPNHPSASSDSAPTARERLA